MSQSSRSFQISLLSMSLLTVFIILYLVAARRLGKSESTPKVVKHTVETPAEDVLKYWTADRMRGAAPAPLPTTNALKHKKRQRHSESPSSQAE